MKAYVFPGQGSQFLGMGKYIYKNLNNYKKFYKIVNEILEFDIFNIFFNENEKYLKQTKIVQIAIYIYSILKIKNSKKFYPDMVAGHSLGEISALVAADIVNFKNGLIIVKKRGSEMQNICENIKSGMAAVLGLKDNIVENVCNNIIGNIVPANYNCPGQIIISGEIKALNEACKKLKDKGGKILFLPVSGAFHSPLMFPVCKNIEKLINNINFKIPKLAFYQNVISDKTYDIFNIKKNLIQQLITPVRWTKLIKKMIDDGANEFIEVGPGNILQGLIKKINKKIKVSNL